uniref:Chondroitin sulfate proteoglycan 5a n=1 Tax=Xiphophorus couchianus TaxID=32473 RepID=A0A3B5L696_9TELE
LDKNFSLFAGMVLGINATEPDDKVNTTSTVIEEDGPVKVNDVMATVTGMSTSRAGRMPRGDKDDTDSSGMFPAPTVEKVSVAATPQIIPDSAETDLLLPSNPLREDVVKGEEEGDEEEEAAATNPSNQNVLHVDFFDPSSRGRNLNLAPPSPSSLAHELQGAEATSWAMPENYDYLTPYDDGMTTTVDEYSYSTTTDAYETEEDLREAAGSPARSRPRVPGSGSFIPGGSYPGAAPNVLPNGCRVGYQLVNGSCRSACETQPNYCLNGGQCYQLDGEEIFCRENYQPVNGDYLELQVATSVCQQRCTFLLQIICRHGKLHSVKEKYLHFGSVLRAYFHILHLGAV